LYWVVKNKFRRVRTIPATERRTAAGVHQTQRRAFIRRWAEYVRTHDDEEWSRQQNKLIDSQLQTASEMTQRGETDPVAFVEARDRLRTNDDE
jgi:hypothetical protein